MKRSEMLDNIHYILDSNYPIGISDFKFIANSILCTIESEGMLPPVSDNKLVDDGNGGQKHSATERKWDE